MRKAFVDLLVAEFPVLDIKRIDRGHDHPMRRLHLLDEFLAAQNHCVVGVDPKAQIFPSPGVGP